MYNINIVLISLINQLKIIRYYFKVVIRISDMSILILSWFYELYLYYSDIVCISFISIYELAYIILISSANSQFRLYFDFKIYIQSCLYYSDIGHSDFKTIIQSCLYYLISSVYCIYIYESAFRFVWQIEFPIFVNSRHKIAAELPKKDINSQKSPRIFENKLYDFEVIFLHLTCGSLKFYFSFKSWKLESFRAQKS